MGQYYQDIGAMIKFPESDTYGELLGAGMDAIAARFAQAHGKFLYVSSIDGDNTYDGEAWNADADNLHGPVADIDTALGLATASNNDVIVVMPGHSEELGNESLVVDVAGVTIMGVGRGSKQPQIVYAHGNSEISVTADNVTICGLRLTSSITTVLVGIEIEDGVDNCEVCYCRFDVDTTGTDEFNVCVRTNDASNRAHIHHNYVNMGIAAAVSAFSMTKDTDETEIDHNVVMGDFSTACINGITTLSTNLLIHDNMLMNGLTGDVGTEPGIELVTGSTGWVYNNYIGCNLATKAAAIVGDAVMLFENYYCETVAETGGIIGTASADDG